MDKKRRNRRKNLPMGIGVEPETGRRIKDRWNLLVDWLTDSIFIMIVYGSGVGVVYFMLWLGVLAIQDDMVKYPFLNEWVGKARIGLALLALISTAGHCAIATVYQFNMWKQVIWNKE